MTPNSAAYKPSNFRAFSSPNNGVDKGKKFKFSGEERKMSTEDFKEGRLL